jgi:hypothetical protein
MMVKKSWWFSELDEHNTPQIFGPFKTLRKTRAAAGIWDLIPLKRLARGLYAVSRPGKGNYDDSRYLWKGKKKGPWE